MKRRILMMSACFLSLAVSSALAQTAPAPAPAAPAAPAAGDKRDMTPVPIRRVVLFSSGVGFFQHSGPVTGNAATELRFKTDQINDILKSLVVSDISADGQVKSITYGSQNPIARTLKSFQIDISANPTLAGILNQIRGTKISLSLNDEKVEGTVLGVEEKDRPVGKPEEQKVIKVSYVNLITSAGIRSVPLDDVKKLEIQDEALQKELDQALAALTQARDKDKKPVIVNFDGTGQRLVTVSYLVETPVWKTSYRLILPDATSKDNAMLVGWAIVENQTDNDWNDVTLDLVGGRPISFIQDLYQPLYIPRPRVAPKTYASLTPQTYDDGTVAARDAEQVIPGSNRASQAQAGGFGGGGALGGAAGGAGGGRGGRGGAAAGAMPLAPAATSPAGFAMGINAEDAPMDYSQGVKSIADASKVGEMFQYSVKGVSLPRQRSSMIPIITQSVPFDRVSIYNRSVLARNPLLGVRLKNQTKNYLLAGPLAVLDKVKRPDNSLAESYAGDANIDDLPPGQERLLSYAVDQDVVVDSSKREGRQRLVTGSIVKGVLHLRYIDSVSQTYVIDNKGDRDRTVLVEDPIEPGYDLKSPPKALEKTDRVYRFEQAVGPKKAVTFDVVEEKTRMEQIAILPMDVGSIDFYVRQGEIPAKVKDVLRTAADKRRAMIDIERRIQVRQADRNQVLQDEENIRNNIRVAPSNSKVYQDSVNDLAAKEAERKQAETDIKTLQASLEKARDDMEKYLSDTDVAQ